jgi:membrane glycosyltransferase
MIEMLAGINTSASMAAVQRTRRVVLEAANEMREQRSRNRRNAAIVALTITGLAMMLTPAIWSALDDFLAGEGLDGMHGMVMVLILMLFSTIFGVLIASFKGQGNLRYGRHGRR